MRVKVHFPPSPAPQPPQLFPHLGSVAFMTTPLHLGFSPQIYVLPTPRLSS